jgi:hypothetical protein
LENFDLPQPKVSWAGEEFCWIASGVVCIRREIGAAARICLAVICNTGPCPEEQSIADWGIVSRKVRAAMPQGFFAVKKKDPGLF